MKDSRVIAMNMKLTKETHARMDMDGDELCSGKNLWVNA